MGQLRDRMEQDLKLKRVSPATIRNYLLYCRKFAAFYMRSPEELGAAEVRAFLLHEIEVEQLAYASTVRCTLPSSSSIASPWVAPGKSAACPFPSVNPPACPRS